MLDMISPEMISLQTTKNVILQGTRLCFSKGWEKFFVLTSMRWYVESLSRKKKAGGGAPAAASATAAFLQARESSSLPTLRGCSQTSLARHTASISLGLGRGYVVERGGNGKLCRRKYVVVQ